MLWIPLLLLAVATIVDVRRREIPDWIPVALLVWAAIGAHVIGVQSRGWVAALAGFGMGSALGLLLFWLGGFGGGDAKVLAALGAVLGPQAFLSLLFYVALAGGLMALIAAVRGQRDLAYAPAIALGFLMLMITQGLP